MSSADGSRPPATLSGSSIDDLTWSRPSSADGLRLVTPSDDLRISLHATLEISSIGPVDLVLILTKSFDTRSGAEAARPLVGPETLVLTLQNGLGNLETTAATLGSECAVLGMTYLGAAVRGPGHVEFTAAGATFIGEPDGRLSDRSVSLADTLSAAGVPTEATDRLWDMVWGKLLINAALDATCALTDASGEDVLRSAAASE